MRSIIALLAALIISGCSTHYHTLTVTSTPSAQRLSVVAYDKNGRPVTAENVTNEMVTPYDLVFEGSSWKDVWKAEVKVNFCYSDQTKVVCFPHAPKITESYCEPAVGLTIFSKETESTLGDRKVHFDLHKE